ncbi:apoptosis facilitator Bcl-2-like protein 14 isoform X4 [Haplochromis burtoni]|uniref:apoptosis facilitator Bcl-2-like protein 14 isoform X4 n=1 Tax=Haplochromis burtoni TaxID=8153 RepID=UPI001C2CE8DD|nr:apoptosis facilitator Bcl-2-like protein 14 isoform X4 [Haplochromis burtoni]
MTSQRAEDATETSEVFQLLEKYCSKRSKQRSPEMAVRTIAARRVKGNVPVIFPEGPAPSASFQKSLEVVLDGEGESSTCDEVHNRMLSTSAHTDDIVQRLVELIRAEGDDIDRKIKQNLGLQQQLRDLDYDMFKELTSSVQSLVHPAEQAAPSEVHIQRQKIALAFEVTSRLSATSLVHQRRVLSFGERYIQENHSAWVEQHRGWAEAFSID